MVDAPADICTGPYYTPSGLSPRGTPREEEGTAYSEKDAEGDKVGQEEVWEVDDEDYAEKGGKARMWWGRETRIKSVDGGEV
jgi:hypothetical protein